MLPRVTLCISLLSLVSAVAAQSPLILSLRFDETGGLVANDAGPLGNNGNLVNFTADPVQWTAGVMGNALTFDGTDDHVDIPFNGGLPFHDGAGASFSIAFWVRGQPQDDDRIVSLSNSTNNSPLFTLGTGRTSVPNDDRLQLYQRSLEGRSMALYSDTPVFDGSWHHVVYTETSGLGKLYVDGVRDTASFDARGTMTRHVDYGTWPFDQLSLGAVTRQAPAAHFQGDLDELYVFGFELSPADVTTLQNGGMISNCRASLGEFGTGCGSGPFELYGGGDPTIGGAGLVFLARGGEAGSPVLLCVGVGALQPIDLTPLGFAGCTYYPNGSTCLGVGTLDGFGSSAPIPFAIPNAPSLACLRVGFQVIAPTATGLLASNAVVTVLGN